MPLTTFTFTFVCKVSSPVEDKTADYNGFIVEVKTPGVNGTEEKGYVQ